MIAVPVVDMREEPSIDSRVSSQVLWGERLQLRGQDGTWSFVQTPDGYMGWIPSRFLIEELPALGTSKIESTRLASHVFSVKDTEFGPLCTIPFGSPLFVLSEECERWLRVRLPNGKEGYVQRGDVVPEPPIHNKGDLVPFSQKFLGIPYTWGGRSSFGFDCSGFTQMLYGRMGVLLPRNACQQMRDSRFEETCIQDLEPGDLIFFVKSEEKMHVGLFCGSGTFIHTSAAKENQPYLRMSKLSDFEWSGSKNAYYPKRFAISLKPPKKRT